MTESTSLTIAQRTALIPAFSMDEGELLTTLGNSIYPGAKPASIKMVVLYCKANLLDPFQKPVHIVPMSRKTGRKDEAGKDIYEDVDTIMPGIGLYRVQATRAGEHGGTSEPEFGPTVKRKLGEVEIEFPEWCKVVVKRIQGSRIVDFVAKEFWLENYATKSRWTVEPNLMWRKRPFAQLAKCCEAQALRKGFPELGASPTAEEMEGKTLTDDGDIVPTATVTPKPQVMSKSEAAKANAIDVDATTGEVVVDAELDKKPKEEEKTSPPASPGMRALIRSKAKNANVDEEKLCAWHSVTGLDVITVAIGNLMLQGISQDAAKYAAS